MKNLKLIFIPALMILALFSCQKDAENLEAANHSDHFVQDRTYECEFEKNLDKTFCIQSHKAVSINDVAARSGYSGNPVIPEKLEAFEPAIDSGGWIIIENGEHDLHVLPYHETDEDIAFYVNDWTEGNDGWVISKGAVTVEQPAGTPLTNELQVLPFISQSLENGVTLSEIEQSILPYGAATVQEDTLGINLNDNAVFPDNGGEYLIWDPCRNFQERAVDKYLKGWGIDDETTYGSTSDYNAVRQGVWDLLAEGPISEPNGQECGNCFFNQFQIAKNLFQNYGAYLTDEQEETVKRNFVEATLNLNESEVNELFAFSDENNEKLLDVFWESFKNGSICEGGSDIDFLISSLLNDEFVNGCSNYSSTWFINTALNSASGQITTSQLTETIFSNIETVTFEDCYDSDNEGWGVVLKVMKLLKKVYKAAKAGKDLSKGSTWKDIIFELFDKAMILSDGQVTPDEIIEAILDLGLGINFDDIKWIKRFLGFGDNLGLTGTLLENAFDKMRDGGRHAMRHLRGKGIPQFSEKRVSSQRLAEIREQFIAIAKPILENPTKVVPWSQGGYKCKAYLGEHNGEPVVFIIAEELTDPNANPDLIGSILTTLAPPSDGQLKYILGQ